MGKALRDMTIAELLGEIAAARAAEAAAEMQDVMAAWIEQRDAARERQRLATEEWVRRRRLFVAAGGMNDE